MTATEAILPILAHIQANLDADLSLERLAERAGYSPFHFHRAFEAEVGETLKAYTLRLRLERAALRLLLHGGTVLDVAVDCGFNHPATFSRAFRRRFGEPPTSYRARGRTAIESDGAAQDAEPVTTEFTLSGTRIVELKDAHLAFIRHVGPYELVDPHRTVFGRLPGMPDIRIIGLPVVEVYHTTLVDTHRSISNTDLYIPVERGPAWPGTRQQSTSTPRPTRSSRSSSSPIV